MRVPTRGAGPRAAAARLLSAGAAAGLVVLAGCGTSLLSTSATTAPGATTASTTGSPTATTVPVNGEVAVAFPVVACTDPTAGGQALTSPTGWKPTILMAPVPTSLAGKVAFYSDGTHTVLGPSGWTCAKVAPGGPTGADGSGTGSTTTTTPYGTTTTTSVPSAAATGQSAAIDAQGATTLAVYPSNDPVPPTSGAPAPGAEGIFATWATTGSDAGVLLVCPFFTLPSWQTQSSGCPFTKPAAGELTNASTPDVTAVADPAGVVGDLAASGGQNAVTGVVLFPQVPAAVSYGRSVAVAGESCSLETPSLCATVLSDFEVREFPVPA